MFRIKICGVTRIEDAVAVADAGADAIGFNFYPPSPRSVDRGQAARLAESVAGRLMRVGVFVNATASEIAETVSEVPLDAIQLHGGEPADLVPRLPAGTPVVRVTRIEPDGLGPAGAYADACRAAGRPLAGVLVDASPASGASDHTRFGGSGRTVDWTRVAAEAPTLAGTPLLLAGGLSPDNVRAAIATARPAGVDTASGVEDSPGVKRAELIEAFVAEAFGAFAAVGT